MFIAAEVACLGLYSIWIKGHIAKDGKETIDWTVTSGQADLYGVLIGLFILIGYLAVLLYQYKTEKRKQEIEERIKDTAVLEQDPYKNEKWLKELLEHFNVYLMDQYFQDMPERVRADLLTSYDCWSGIINSSAFIIHDAELLRLIQQFHQQWGKIVSFGCKYYFTSPNPQYYRFEQYQLDTFRTSEAQEAFEQIAQMVLQLQPVYKTLIDYIKEHYPDIDFDETSKTFLSSLAKI